MDLQSLLQHFPDITPNDRSLIERAYHKAEVAHAGQKRKSGEPFFTHCVAVAHILADLRLDPEAIAAALLHDVLEDTSVKVDELRREFGEKITAMVEGVTKIEQKVSTQVTDKRSRSAARDLENIRKIMLAMDDDVRVVLVKLADRLHNMRTLGFMSRDRQVAIAQETLEIFAPLASRLGIWQIKWELEDLSLRYLNPEAYKSIAASIDERRADREAYMTDVIKELRAALVPHNIEVAISGRPKHIYSIFKKMDRKNLPFDQIYDVRAVRVIVDTVPQCYLVLGVVHNLWRPVPGEFDDYIAAPKDNYYRSLHTAVIDNHGNTVEVQIRTWEMHEHAEYGIAAHWRYKEGNTSSRDETFERQLMNLRRMLEFGSDVDNAEQYVDTLKNEVLQDRVYAYTPKGDIIDLPRGATAVDFAYHIHTEIGNRCRGAKINGQLVSLDYELKTGDRVEILTAKRGGPSLDWLNPNLGYVRTSRAQAKIRQYLKKQNHEKNIANGREVLEREMKRLSVESMPFESVSALFSMDKLDDFLAQVGAGDINASQISNRILEIVLEAERRDQREAALKEMFTPKPAQHAVPVEATNGINIMGTGGLLVNLARCCNPTQGEEIIGYITRGRGVTVHRQDCANIAVSMNNEPERLINVNWGRVTNEQRYPVPVQIVAYDREGLMRDIGGVIADERVNMSTVNVSTRQNIATFQVTMEISSIQQLARILTKIEQLPNVVEARRRTMV